MHRSVRLALGIGSLAVTAVIAAGAVAQAASSPAGPPSSPQPSSTATLDPMRSMHGQLMRDNPAMARMHAELNQRVPGMARMDELMRPGPAGSDAGMGGAMSGMMSAGPGSR